MNFTLKSSKPLAIVLTTCLILLVTPASYAGSDDDVYVTTISPSCSIVSHESPGKAFQLSCKSYHQTTDYTCGPAAVMVLMHYYHKLSDRDMNRQTELRIAGEMGASAGSGGGTTESQVEGWLSDHGFSVSSGQGVDTNFLIESIQSGKPVLIGFSQHWILAKGFSKGKTPEEDKIIFADSCCNVSIMSREVIDSMGQDARMRGNHCEGNIGQYIVAVPN